MSVDFLRGTRVLDLSQYVPGPYATQMLADLGADMLKVEPPGGDPMRGLGPRDADGISPFWKTINAGKAVVEIDLKLPVGTALLADLLRRADVLLESYRPGVLDRLGFDAARLDALNKRLIHATLTGYGATGPWAERSGHDVNYMAVAGGIASSGSGAAPMMAMPPVADFASGLQSALTITAALLGRRSSGRGARLDLSLAETVLGWQSMSLTLAARGEAPARAAEPLNGGAACYQLYRCADGRFVSLGAIETKFWRNFCHAVGRAAWIARQQEAMPQTELIAEVATLFAGREAAEWESLLGLCDCCFAIVLDAAAVASHPQIVARGLIDNPADGLPRREVRFPAWIDGSPSPSRIAVRRITRAQAAALWR